jgi:hypothetical protein
MKNLTLIGSAAALATGCVAGVIVALTNLAQPSAPLPPNVLTCTRLTAGLVTAYEPVPDTFTSHKLGTWTVTGGRECSWSYPSADVNGVSVNEQTNPPITLVTSTGKTITIPGDCQVYYAVYNRGTRKNP